jgi:hypothetical protein
VKQPNMTAYLLANHLLNFVAPAFFVALLVVLASSRLPGGRLRSPGRLGWRQQFALVSGVNVLVLAAGLVLFSQDGKLLTYAAMALASALAQWLLRGWKT